MGVSPNEGYHFGSPKNKDYSILRSILGSPYFVKLPYRAILVSIPRYCQIVAITIMAVIVMFSSSVSTSEKERSLS